MRVSSFLVVVNVALCSIPLLTNHVFSYSFPRSPLSLCPCMPQVSCQGHSFDFQPPFCWSLGSLSSGLDRFFPTSSSPQLSFSVHLPALQQQLSSASTLGHPHSSCCSRERLQTLELSKPGTCKGRLKLLGAISLSPPLLHDRGRSQFPSVAAGVGKTALGFAR